MGFVAIYFILIFLALGIGVLHSKENLDQLLQ
jgi:hypothetical protein